MNNPSNTDSCQPFQSCSDCLNSENCSWVETHTNTSVSKICRSHSEMNSLDLLPKGQRVLLQLVDCQDPPAHAYYLQMVAVVILITFLVTLLIAFLVRKANPQISSRTGEVPETTIGLTYIETKV